MFKSYYSFHRFRYWHKNLVEDPRFSLIDSELIPKTAVFISPNIDVYIDTSDGVNDDLKIQEYCGRIYTCAQLSAGKKFLFFKCAHSSQWSKDIEDYASKHNGTVIPFFKWSFNDYFYSKLIPNLQKYRIDSEKLYDVGLFANFSKQYSYPKPSISNPLISHDDHRKFGIPGSSHDTGKHLVNSRPDILKLIQESRFTNFHGSLSYEEYLKLSLKCRSVLNPPGVGEYTSRMMDQLALGNLIVLRSNSYDNGNSWKEHIPEIDFSKPDWEDSYQRVLDDANLWKEKGRYYYEKLWSPKAIYDYFIDNTFKRT